MYTQKLESVQYSNCFFYKSLSLSLSLSRSLARSQRYVQNDKNLNNICHVIQRDCFFFIIFNVSLLIKKKMTSLSLSLSLLLLLLKYKECSHSGQTEKLFPNPRIFWIPELPNVNWTGGEGTAYSATDRRTVLPLAIHTTNKLKIPICMHTMCVYIYMPCNTRG